MRQPAECVAFVPAQGGMLLDVDHCPEASNTHESNGVLTPSVSNFFKTHESQLLIHMLQRQAPLHLEGVLEKEQRKQIIGERLCVCLLRAAPAPRPRHAATSASPLRRPQAIAHATQTSRHATSQPPPPVSHRHQMLLAMHAAPIATKVAGMFNRMHRMMHLHVC